MPSGPLQYDRLTLCIYKVMLRKMLCMLWVRSSHGAQLKNRNLCENFNVISLLSVSKVLYTLFSSMYNFSLKKIIPWVEIELCSFELFSPLCLLNTALQTSKPLYMNYNQHSSIIPFMLRQFFTLVKVEMLRVRIELTISAFLSQ